MTKTISLKSGTTEDDGACLLNYLPSTYPVPIQTGAGQTPAQAVLNTAALPGAGQTVYCNQVVIAVPVGSDPGDIFQQPPTASVNTGKWAVTATLELKKGHELWLDDDIDYAIYTFDCRDEGDYLINYNLVFGVAGPVSPVASQCTVQIMENSGTSKDSSTFTSKTCSYTVTTSTPQFYLQNFAATAAGAPTVPATEFANGADINFSWESNGTFFQLFEKGIPKPVWAGTQTACTLKGGVKTDTTFVLVAMVSGDPSGDRPQANYQPIYLYDALTITISNPDLTPSSANIAGNATVGGTLGVGTTAPLSKLHVIAPGGFGPEKPDGTSLPGNVPIVAQSNGTAVGIINGHGRQAFGLNIDGDGGTSAARGVPTFYDKFDGNWHSSLALRNGNVGIGTANPSQPLHVVGGAIVESNDSWQTAFQIQNDSSGKNFQFLVGGSGNNTGAAGVGGFGIYDSAGGFRFNINSNGNVGIGTTNPTQALLVVNGVGPAISANQYGYLNNRDPTGFWKGTQQVQYSIWASYRVASVEFNAFSDARIKNITGRSDSAADLRTLLSLEVTDYRHKDVVGKGDVPQKKLVAQQVEQVFPQAVGRTTDAVPDIYRPARLTDGWVELPTDLKAGERVRLIAGDVEAVYEVLEVTPERFRTASAPEAAEVFVYGREVDDFRTLDYDAVAMLNVSATQQLKREKDEEVEALRAENDALLKRLERLESRMEAALSLLATAANGAGRKL